MESLAVGVLAGELKQFVQRALCGVTIPLGGCRFPGGRLIAHWVENHIDRLSCEFANLHLCPVAFLEKNTFV